MQENNDKEIKQVESSEEETKVVIIPDNPSVSATEVLGKVYVASEEEGFPDLTAWARDLPREEATDEKVELYIDDDHFAVGFGGAAEITVPLSMVEELIAAYRAEVATRIRTTS